MSVVIKSQVEMTSGLLRSLPSRAWERLRPSLVSFDMAYGQVLQHQDGEIQHLYFVNRGLVSLVKTMRDGRTVEISAIGPEGVADPYALFGIDNAITESVVQIPGTAVRLSRDILVREMARDESLNWIMRKYMRFAVEQIVQTAACNRLHSLEERCCRWLLIAHDGALSDTFPLTHHFLATMLGVQRSGVTLAARLMKRAGLIRYTRASVTVMDRAGLEEAACECYGTIRNELHKILATKTRATSGGCSLQSSATNNNIR